MFNNTCMFAIKIIVFLIVFVAHTGLSQAQTTIKRFIPINGLILPFTFTVGLVDSQQNTDQDGDGVSDALDQCNSTAQAVDVNAIGCSTTQLQNGDILYQQVNCINKETGLFRLAWLCVEYEEVDADLDGIVDIEGASSNSGQLPTECPAQ